VLKNVLESKGKTANPGLPGRIAVKQVCVFVCACARARVCVCVFIICIMLTICCAIRLQYRPKESKSQLLQK